MTVPEPTRRLVLRAWRDEDYPPFAAMNADARVMEFMPGLMTREESDAQADQIIAHLATHGFGLWALERRDTGEFIGYVGLKEVPFEGHFTPAVEIAWRLAAPHWGQGFATEGAAAALDFAFASLNLAEVVSFTATINTRSWRVMEKLGMVHDAAGDFDHPRLALDHPLCQHVLYRMPRQRWQEISVQQLTR